MRTLERTALLVVSVVALSAWVPSSVLAADTAADEATLRAGTETWLAAYSAGEVDRIVALYAPDGIMMPPNAASASGHAAMRDYHSFRRAHR